MFGIGGCEEVTSSIFWAQTGARKSGRKKRSEMEGGFFWHHV